VRVPTLNLNNSANILVQQYGPEDALLMAAKRVDAYLMPCVTALSSQIFCHRDEQGSFTRRIARLVCSTAFDARLSSKLTYGDVHEVIGPAMIGYELRFCLDRRRACVRLLLPTKEQVGRGAVPARAQSTPCRGQRRRSGTVGTVRLLREERGR
jgi:hypothetical protein